MTVAVTGDGRDIRSQLVALTGAKVVSNTALRWVAPFLPTLERAFGTSTGTLTGIMGVAELGGLTTLATGSHLDRGRERTVFLSGLSLVALGCALSLVGDVWAFGAGFVLIILGISNHTVAGHAWIGHRVPFSNRSRAIGMFETSWAFALLLGAPVIAVLIELFGWRGPYVALTVGLGLVGAWVAFRVEPSRAHTPVATADAPPSRRLPASAWPPMLASASTAMAGIGVFVVSGAWLDDDYGVSTAGLGLIAALFGGVELVSSASVAAFADRVGVRRSVAAGLVLLLCGLVLMGIADGSRAIAVIGLAVFLGGFEYAMVASISFVTEAAPESRGRAIGISNAIGTLARATALIASGQLYDAFGIAGSMTMAAAAAVAGLGFTALAARGRAR